MASNNSNREVIVDKLNGALAMYRRERDDLRRKKELATERLRMKCEERQELEKALRLSEEKLECLVKAAKSNTCVPTAKDGLGKSLEDLEIQVDQMRKEAKFQHSEMVSKREKLELIELHLQHEAKERSISLRLSKEAARNRRQSINRKMDTIADAIGHQLSEESMKRKIDELSDEEIFRLPKMIEKRADSFLIETQALNKGNSLLEKKLNGYCRFLGIQIPVVGMDL